MNMELGIAAISSRKMGSVDRANDLWRLFQFNNFASVLW
jgi:hypothetical protein